ncbi:MAG TPA: hypothetical protein VN833_22635 [Candidatus Acidoferrales bacterium]|nr:hypothetical protein [Candidatus Acidoferrales bacterium]
MDQRATSRIRAIGRGPAALVQAGDSHCRGTAGARFRSSPLGRVLAVLAATIVVLIVSAIVLPPEGSQVRSGEGSGEGPVSVSH